MRAINDMPAPTYQQGVQRILGKVSFVQKSTPNLVDLVKLLWNLSRRKKRVGMGGESPWTTLKKE